MSFECSATLGGSNMKLLGLFAFPIAVALGMACSSPPSAGTAKTSAAPNTTRMGVHGMVLFGSERIFLSHIPMYTPPHDMQALFEVKIGTGVPAASQQFSDKSFTIQPTEKFSLDELMKGTLKGFTATVYLGNFEAGGTPLYRDVRFDVVRVVYQRPMTAAMTASDGIDYLAIGTPNDAFLVHLIDKPPSFDQILHVKLPAAFLDAASLEKGAPVRLASSANELGARAMPGKTAEVAKAKGEPGTAIEVKTELSCLVGNDFGNACNVPARP
jgi:hypothetical protein